MAVLNRAGRSYARSLISSGRVDKTSAWTFTAEDGNKLLGSNGDDWTNYGKNHLGADPNENFDTKDHWKYPFAKEGTLYRSALTAIRQRASQQKDKAVYDAAGALLDEIDGNSDRQHENSASKGPSADAVTITTRPPRIELDIQPRMDMASAPPSADVLERWTAGIRAAQTDDSDSANIIEIYDVIGYDFWSGGGITTESVAEQLKSFNGADCEVHINSPGGDMFEGIGIYNVLNQYPGKVEVKIMALAASAASVIAMAGDEISIGNGAFIMIHNCWVVAAGNRNDMAEVAQYLEPFDRALADIYVARTGQKAADVTKWMDAETFFSAQQCIQYGFADSTLTQDLTEDKEATKQAKALNQVRKVEQLLTRKGGLTRSQARAAIQEIKGSKLSAAAGENGGKPGAAADTTQDAGDRDWTDAAKAMKALIDSLKAK